MMMEVYFAVFLTECQEPWKPAAIFESHDQAREWAKLNYQGKGWKIRHTPMPEIREMPNSEEGQK